MFQHALRTINGKENGFVYPDILFREEHCRLKDNKYDEIVRRLRAAKLFLIYTGLFPRAKVSIDLNCIAIQLSTAINLVADFRTLDLKRGSKESLKHFTINLNYSVQSDVLFSSQLRSRKFLMDDEIEFLKLTEEPDLVVCETDERRRCYNEFNISAITFFQALNEQIWIASVCQFQKVFIEGSLHHALKTRFSKQFGLRYISIRALKKQGLIR